MRENAVMPPDPEPVIAVVLPASPAARYVLRAYYDDVEARRLYARHGYTETRPFSHGPYSDHWFVKDGPFGIK